MTFRKNKVLAGAAVMLVACLGAIQSASARPLIEQSDELLFSQVNQPEREAVPQLNTLEIRGEIVAIEGDQVQVRTTENELVSYTIEEEVQQNYEMAVGDDVVLLVRENEVIGINPPVGSTDPNATTTTGAVGPGGTVDGTTTGGVTVERSETTTRQETTVQQQSQSPQQSAPTTSEPVSQPVRALW